METRRSDGRTTRAGVPRRHESLAGGMNAIHLREIFMPRESVELTVYDAVDSPELRIGGRTFKDDKERS